MTGRELIAFALMIAMAAGLAALVWWRRYLSYPRSYARQQEQRRKQDEARALARAARDDGEVAS